jgi:hypothetical protein
MGRDSGVRGHRGARRRCSGAGRTRPSFVNDKAWFPEGNFRCASIVAAPLLAASLWRLYAVEHL